MDNFIDIGDYDASIHREILDSLLRSGSDDYDPQIVEICEDRAVSEMRSYMNKTYDCDDIFSARGEDRHPLILMFAIDIAIYHIYCQHNPYKMSKIRQDRYVKDGILAIRLSVGYLIILILKQHDFFIMIPDPA